MKLAPGNTDIQGNELSDKQAKEVANEMVRAADVKDFSIRLMDKKEAVAEIKRNLKENEKVSLSWQKRLIKYRRVFFQRYNVRSRNCFEEEDRHNFAMLNQPQGPRTYRCFIV